MAALSRVVQMITRDSQDPSRDRVFMTEEVQGLIDSWDSQAPEDSSYTIVSIIGPQSTGKSTLLNKIFQAGFEVMGSNIFRRQTTMGVWVTVSNDPRAIVIDTEGADGINQQDDIGFENQSALLALLLSDVIFINLWENETGRLHGGFITTLTTIFQEMTHHERHKTKIVFSVRDYDGQGTHSEYMDYFNTRANEIWRKIPRNGDFAMDKYIQIYVELLPSPKHKWQEFEEKCQDLYHLLAGGEFGHGMKKSLRARDFPTNAASLWGTILRDERLHLPSHMAMMYRQFCESIMRQKLQIESAQLLQTTTESFVSPNSFLRALHNNICCILSQYENETSSYEKDIANEIKERLKTLIIEKNRPAFRRTLERKQQEFLVRTMQEIAANMKYKVMPGRFVESTIQEYNLMFDTTIIAGLDYYHDEITNQKKIFFEHLTCFTQQKAVEIVAARWALFNDVMIGAAVIGACIATVYVLVVLVKFGVPAATAVVKQNLPVFLKVLGALKNRSLKIIVALLTTMLKVLPSTWKSLSAIVIEATRSDHQSTVDESINILHRETGVDRNLVRLFVLLVLAAMKVTQQQSQTPS